MKFHLSVIILFSVILSLPFDVLAVNSAFYLTASEASAPSIVTNGVRLLIPSSATAHVPSYGTATSTGIARRMIARVRTGSGIAVVGMVALEGYTAWVDSHPQDNPIAYRLLHPDNSTPVGLGIPDVGQSLSHNGQTLYVSRIGQTGVYTGANLSSPTSYYHQVTTAGGITDDYFYIPEDAPAYGLQHYTVVTVSTTNPLAQPALTPEQFGDALGDLYPELAAEVDKYIQSHPDSVQLPSDIQQQIDRAAIDLPEFVDTDGDGIPDHEDDDIDGDGIPNSEDSDIDGDGVPNSEEVDDTDGPSPPEPPGYDSVNYQPLIDMGQGLSTKFPFTLLTTLKNFGNSLIASPVAPRFRFTFPAPFNVEFDIDLSRFDGIASMVRTIIAMTILATVTMTLLRRFH